MEERTERIETTRAHPNTRDETMETAHTTTPPPPPPSTTSEVRRVERPAAEVDHLDAVAYDPYAERRQVAYRMTQLIYWIFGLVEGLILIRFVLKVLGANPAAGFAEFVYGITAPLVQPFVGLFSNPQSAGSVLEFSSLTALVVYALVAWLLAKLVWILVGDVRTAIHSHSKEIDSRI